MDPEVFVKAIYKLNAILSDSTAHTKNVIVQKRVINTCTQLYPVILKWAARKKSTDSEARRCWEAFSMLKERIIHAVDSNNEGYLTINYKYNI